MSSSKAMRLAIEQLSGACVVEGLRHLVERKQKLFYDAHEIERDVYAATRGTKRYTDRTGRVTVVACAGHCDLEELKIRVQDVARRFAEIGASLRAAAQIRRDDADHIDCKVPRNAPVGASVNAFCANGTGRTEHSHTAHASGNHMCAMLAARLCAARELWLVELNFFHWDHNIAQAWPESSVDDDGAEGSGVANGGTRRVKSLCRWHCCSGHSHRIVPLSDAGTEDHEGSPPRISRDYLKSRSDMECSMMHARKHLLTSGGGITGVGLDLSDTLNAEEFDTACKFMCMQTAGYLERARCSVAAVTAAVHGVRTSCRGNNGDSEVDSSLHGLSQNSNGGSTLRDLFLDFVRTTSGLYHVVYATLEQYIVQVETKDLMSTVRPLGMYAGASAAKVAAEVAATPQRNSALLSLLQLTRVCAVQCRLMRSMFENACELELLAQQKITQQAKNKGALNNAGFEAKEETSLTSVSAEIRSLCSAGLLHACSLLEHRMHAAFGRPYGSCNSDAERKDCLAIPCHAKHACAAAGHVIQMCTVESSSVITNGGHSCKPDISTRLRSLCEDLVAHGIALDAEISRTNLKQPSPRTLSSRSNFSVMMKHLGLDSTTANYRSPISFLRLATPFTVSGKDALERRIHNDIQTVKSRLRYLQERATAGLRSVENITQTREYDDLELNPDAVRVGGATDAQRNALEVLLQLSAEREAFEAHSASSLNNGFRDEKGNHTNDFVIHDARHNAGKLLVALLQQHSRARRAVKQSAQDTIASAMRDSTSPTLSHTLAVSMLLMFRASTESLAVLLAWYECECNAATGELVQARVTVKLARAMAAMARLLRSLAAAGLLCIGIENVAEVELFHLRKAQRQLEHLIATAQDETRIALTSKRLRCVVRSALARARHAQCWGCVLSRICCRAEHFGHSQHGSAADELEETVIIFARFSLDARAVAEQCCARAASAESSFKLRYHTLNEIALCRSARVTLDAEVAFMTRNLQCCPRGTGVDRHTGISQHEIAMRAMLGGMRIGSHSFVSAGPWSQPRVFSNVRKQIQRLALFEWDDADHLGKFAQSFHRSIMRRGRGQNVGRAAQTYLNLTRSAVICALPRSVWAAHHFGIQSLSLDRLAHEAAFWKQKNFGNNVSCGRGLLLDCLSRLYVPNMRHVLHALASCAVVGTFGTVGHHDLRYLVRADGHVASDVWRALVLCAHTVQTAQITVDLGLLDERIALADLVGHSRKSDLQLRSISAIGLQFCAELLRNNQCATHLHILCCNELGFPRVIQPICAALSRMTSLTELDIRGVATPEQAEAVKLGIANALLGTSFVSLTLDEWAVPRGCSAITLHRASIGDIQLLRTLCVNGAVLNRIILPARLSHEESDITARSRMAIPFLVSQVMYSQSLKMPGCSSCSAALLTELIPYCVANTIDLRDSVIGTSLCGLVSSAFLAGKYNLQSLDVRDCRLRGADMENINAVCESMASPPLRVFCGITLASLWPKDNSEVCSLDLCACNLGDFEACFLARRLPYATALTALNISGNRIGEAGFVCLGSKLGASAVRILDISGQDELELIPSREPLISIAHGVVQRCSRSKDESSACLHKLRVDQAWLSVESFLNSTRMHMKAAGVVDADVHVLSELLRAPCCAQLMRIELPNNAITIDGARILAFSMLTYTGGMCMIEAVDLSFNCIAGDVTVLADCVVELHNLRSLDLVGNSGVASKALLSMLGKHSEKIGTLNRIPVAQIRASATAEREKLSLKLSNLGLGPVEEMIILQCLKQFGTTGIQSLDISENPLLSTDRLLQDLIVDAKPCCVLDSIDVRGTSWSASAMLIDCLASCECKASEDKVTHFCGAPIKSLALNEALSLDLSGTPSCPLTDHGMRAISYSLALAHKLRKIDLSNNDLSAEGIVIMIDALHAAMMEGDGPLALTSLSLADNTQHNIESGIVALARLLASGALGQLRTLDLSNCNAGQCAIDQLVDALYDVSSSIFGMTDSTVPQRCAQQPRHRLKELHLRGNNLATGKWLRKLLRRPRQLRNEGLMDEMGSTVQGMQNSLSSTSTPSLITKLSESALHTLELSSNPLGKEALPVLAQALPGSKLKVLRINCVLPLHLSDSTPSVGLTEVLTPLLEALPHSNLGHLDLSANGIKPESQVAERFQKVCKVHYIKLTL